MTLDYPKEWFEQHIEKEENVEIGAGTPAVLWPAEPETSLHDLGLAFGQFVAFWRRDKGWNAQRLAVTAGLDAEAVRRIERDPCWEPEREAVVKLAEVFGVPARPLLELVGLIADRTPHLREDPIDLGTPVESTAPLSAAERKALEAFLAVLSAEEG